MTMVTWETPDLLAHFDRLAEFCLVRMEQLEGADGWLIIASPRGGGPAIEARAQRFLDAVAAAINSAEKAGLLSDDPAPAAPLPG